MAENRLFLHGKLPIVPCNRIYEHRCKGARENEREKEREREGGREKRERKRDLIAERYSQWRPCVPKFSTVFDIATKMSTKRKQPSCPTNRSCNYSDPISTIEWWYSIAARLNLVHRKQHSFFSMQMYRYECIRHEYRKNGYSVIHKYDRVRLVLQICRIINER